MFQALNRPIRLETIRYLHRQLAELGAQDRDPQTDAIQDSVLAAENSLVDGRLRHDREIGLAPIGSHLFGLDPASEEKAVPKG